MSTTNDENQPSLAGALPAEPEDIIAPDSENPVRPPVNLANISAVDDDDPDRNPDHQEHITKQKPKKKGK